jgi:MFS family permease
MKWINHKAFESIQIPEFKWFLGMRLFIVLAWSIQFVLIEWHVYNITKDPWSLGLIGLMEVIPALVMALFAGHIVDRSNKKMVLIYCFTGLFVSSSFLAFLIHPKAKEYFSINNILLLIYTMIFLGGVIRSFVIPSVFSMLGEIISPEKRPNAAAWSSSTWQFAAIFGPALAGFTISKIGMFGSMCMVLFFIVLAIFCLNYISKKEVLVPLSNEKVWQSLKDGIVFVFQNKIILNALSLDMFAVLFGGAVALIPVFATDILKVGSEGFGILRAAPAIGGLITMLVSTALPLRKNAGKKVLLAVFCFGICMIIFGLSTNFWLSVSILFLSGIADGFSVVIRQTILQIYTPDHMRGRVASVNSIFVGSSNELGAFESGLTSRWFGVVNAVVLGGVLTLLVVIITYLSSSKFVNLHIDTIKKR